MSLGSDKSADPRLQPASPVAQGLDERSDLRLEVAGVGERVHDLRPQQLAESLTQAVHCDLERRLGGAEQPRGLGVGRPLATQVWPQRRESYPWPRAAYCCARTSSTRATTASAQAFA